MQQPVFQRCTRHLDPFGQNERALKRTRGDPTMQEQTFALILRLTTAHDQLAVLYSDIKILIPKPGHGQSDAVIVFRYGFDVEWWVPFSGCFGGPLNQPFQLFKAQKMGMRPKA